MLTQVDSLVKVISYRWKIMSCGYTENWKLLKTLNDNTGIHMYAISCFKTRYIFIYNIQQPQPKKSVTEKHIK